MKPEVTTRVRYWGAGGKLERRKFPNCYWYVVKENGTLVVFRMVKEKYTNYQGNPDIREVRQTVTQYAAGAWHSAE